MSPGSCISTLKHYLKYINKRLHINYNAQLPLKRNILTHKIIQSLSSCLKGNLRIIQILPYMIFNTKYYIHISLLLMSLKCTFHYVQCPFSFTLIFSLSTCSLGSSLLFFVPSLFCLCDDLDCLFLLPSEFDEFLHLMAWPEWPCCWLPDGCCMIFTSSSGKIGWPLFLAWHSTHSFWIKLHTLCIPFHLGPSAGLYLCCYSSQ